MRTLLLLRHAKSDWGDAGLADHDRPLSPRGVRAGPRIVEHLSSGPRPQLVLCSPARRTRETLDLVRPVLPPTAEVRVEDDLYGASATEILWHVHQVAPSVDVVLVIGHNPGLEDLTWALAGDGEEGALVQLRTKFPTGTLATLDVGTSWDELAPGGAHLTRLAVPRR